MERLLDYIKELEVTLLHAGIALPIKREDVLDLLDDYQSTEEG